MYPIYILIVDDNQQNLFSLKNMLMDSLENIEVIEANSGNAALKTLSQQAIDLILLDIQMPEMDGFETARLIRARKKMQHIPIVFLTAAFKSEDFRQQGLALGAADYLTKPIDNVQLISRLQVYLRFIAQERQHLIEILEKNQKLKQENIERQKNQEQLEFAKQMADSASMAKSRFLANMSHELRTPLNAIIGYSELLVEETEGDNLSELNEFSNNILKASGHLLQLINNLLDISRIETNSIHVNNEVITLSNFIQEIVDMIHPLINPELQIFKMQIENNLPKQIKTDATKLKQVLFNLLENAIKFTKQGEIILHVAIEQVGAENYLCWQISDTGIGMSAELLDVVFKPFTQADNSATRLYDGNGLGLAIAKQFTELLEGKILVVSQEMQGTTFTVQLPLKVA